jgi:hypothetical protein
LQLIYSKSDSLLITMMQHYFDTNGGGRS